jgi:hypothetical protein
MKKKGSYRIVEDTQDPFGLAVLCRGVWAGKVQRGAMCRQEGGCGVVDKFRVIVSLKAFYGKAKLGTNVGNKINNCLVDIRLAPEGGGPTEMSIIIQNH